MEYNNVYQMARVSEEMPVCVLTPPETRAERVAVLNASQCPKYKISDFINKQITVVNVRFEKTAFVDDETGEYTEGVRTTLITPEGEGISCASSGVVRSIIGIVNEFGEPTKDEPYKLNVRQIETKNGNRYYQLLLAE